MFLERLQWRERLSRGRNGPAGVVHCSTVGLQLFQKYGEAESLFSQLKEKGFVPSRDHPNSWIVSAVVKSGSQAEHPFRRVVQVLLRPSYRNNVQSVEPEYCQSWLANAMSAPGHPASEEDAQVHRFVLENLLSDLFRLQSVSSFEYRAATEWSL